MNLKNISIVLLAGNPKCLQFIPDSNFTYFEVALTAVKGLCCQKIAVVSDFTFGALMKVPHQKVPGGPTAYDSLMAGLQAVRGELVLVVATDLPLLTEQALRDFLTQVEEAPEADFYCSLATSESCNAAGQKKLGMPIDGKSTACGSVFLVRQAALPAISQQAERILALRRKKLKCALAIVGYQPIPRLALSFLRPSWGFSLGEVELLLTKGTKIRWKGIWSDPGLVVDYDRKSDQT
jgi:hypothetical protein